MSKAKAVGRSVSFRPFSIYEWAVAYGTAQFPPLNLSEVVCHALSEFRAKVDPVSSSNVASELKATIEEIGPEKALAILSRSRRRNRAA